MVELIGSMSYMSTKNFYNEFFLESNRLQKKQVYVALTRLDKECGNQSTVYLGRWCLNLHQKNWQQLIHRCIDYHWKDRKKFKNDYDYLQNLYESLIKTLTSTLNTFHKTNYPQRYWQIIIGPWLMNFISVVFDRWEIIQSLKKTYGSNFDALLTNRDLKVPTDFFEFRGYLDDDLWNHDLFSIIIKNVFPAKKFNTQEFIRNVEENKFNKNFGRRLNPIKGIILKIILFFEHLIKRMLLFIGYKKKYLFHEAGFYRKLFFGINFRLKSFPLTNISFTNLKIHNELSARERLVIKFDKPIDAFEDFLYSIILKNIPIAYIEAYQSIFELSKKEPAAEKIITAYSYWYNEVFKVWSANQVCQNSKLFILEHGGSFQLKRNTMNHTEDISDIHISWGQEIHRKHKRLPPNKLSVVRKKPYSDSDQITLFDFESVRHTYRAVGAPIGSLVLEEHIQNLDFLKLLPTEILSSLKVKPKYLGSWDLEKSFQVNFGTNIISKHNDLNSIIQNSKLIISSYPQTTFSEGMYSGVPTMLIFREDLWDIDEIYFDLIEELKHNKIIHTSAETAANHLIDVQDSIHSWWNSSEVLEARKSFDNLCNTSSLNPSRDWAKFLKSF